MQLPEETASEIHSFVDNFYTEKLSLSLVKESLPFFASTFVHNLVLVSSPTVEKNVIEFFLQKECDFNFPENFSTENYYEFLRNRLNEVENGDVYGSFPALREILKVHKSSSSPSWSESVDSSSNLEEVFITAFWEACLIHNIPFLKEKKAIEIAISLILNNESVQNTKSLEQEDLEFILQFKNSSVGIFKFLLKNKHYKEVYEYSHTPRRYYQDLAIEVLRNNNRFYTKVHGHYGLWDFVSKICSLVGDKKVIQNLVISLSSERDEVRNYLTLLLNCPRLSYKDFCRIFKAEDGFSEYGVVNVGERWSDHDWSDFARRTDFSQSLKEVVQHNLRINRMSGFSKSNFLLKNVINGVNSFLNYRIETFNDFGKKVIFVKEFKKEQFDFLTIKTCLVNPVKFPSSLERRQVKALKELINHIQYKLNQKDLSEELKESLQDSLNNFQAQRNKIRQSLITSSSAKNRLSGIF